jgi:DnaJ-domain-containing protein 1
LEKQSWKNAVLPLITEIRKLEQNCSSARNLKHHVLELQYFLSFASKFAPLSTRKRVILWRPSRTDSMSADLPLITEIRKLEQNCSSARNLKHHVLELQYFLSFASKFAPLSTRKRVISRCRADEYMSAVLPLITEIRKLEQNCSSARNLKHHVLELQYFLSFASKFAPLSTRKRVISRCPEKLFQDTMSAVIPLITEIRKIETWAGAVRARDRQSYFQPSVL